MSMNKDMFHPICRRIFYGLSTVFISLVACILILAWWAVYGVYMFNTAYSPSFSRSAWNDVKIGMDRAEVDHILGPPIDERIVELKNRNATGATTETQAFYSSKKAGDTYFSYSLTFDSSQHVQNKQFYVMD